MTEAGEPSTEPVPLWRDRYLDRKADEFMTALIEKSDLRQVARELVNTVLDEMVIHLLAPHEPPAPPEDHDDEWCTGCETCAPWRKPRDHQVNE